jgi:hypothetical protein
MTDVEIVVISNVASLLTPFRTTLVELQASKTIVLSSVYGLIRTLMSQIEDAKVLLCIFSVEFLRRISRLCFMALGHTISHRNYSTVYIIVLTSSLMVRTTNSIAILWPQLWLI